jgi:hypothetical protein
LIPAGTIHPPALFLTPTGTGRDACHPGVPMLVSAVTSSLPRAASLFAGPAAFMRTAAVTRSVSGSMMAWLLNPSSFVCRLLCACRASGSTVEIPRSGATRRAISHRPSVPSEPSAVVAGTVGDPAHRGPCHLADIYVTGSVVADEHFIALIPPIENEPPATCLGHIHDGWPRSVWKLLRDGLSGRLLGRDNMQRSSASLGDP